MVLVRRADIASRVEKRFQFLQIAAREFVGDAHLDPSDCQLRVEWLRYTAEGYFLLSEAFKAERLVHVLAGSPPRTEPPKIAAMTAVAVMMFRPFRATDNQNIQRLNTYVANELFCIDLTSRIMDQDFEMLDTDMYRRWQRYLKSITSYSLSDYLSHAVLGVIRDEYDIDITRDLATIGALTLINELQWTGGGAMRD